MLEALRNRIIASGVYQYGFVDTADIVFHQEVRDICKGNVCRQYATSWACPPAVGTIDACRDRCLAFDTMMVFSGIFPLEDSFDLDGMHRGMLAFKDTARALEAVLEPHIGAYRVLSNEGCGYCARCTYPDAPCRFPDKLHHAIEGYGLVVNDLARAAGIDYRVGADSIIFFGAVLFHRANLPGVAHEDTIAK